MAKPALSDKLEQDRLARIGRAVRKQLAANPAVQRIGGDKAELWAMARFLGDAECRSLIAQIDAVAQPSVAYTLPGDDDVRTSCTGDLDPRAPLVRAIDLRLAALLGLDPATGEPLEGQRYLPGQYFKPHMDWFAPESPMWQREKVAGQRAFTAMVYLNTVEVGGETDFPELDIAIHPRPGTLVVWNNADPRGMPNPATAHAGNPVIRGSKYVITKWYRTRKPG